MNKRQAKIEALRIASTDLYTTVTQISGYSDNEKVRHAVKEIADELETRAIKLECKKADGCEE